MENVVLLHGALGASGEMQDIAAAFREAGLNPVLFSFSGHGGKAFAGHFGIEAFAGELSAFISSSRLVNPHLFGYSMGGYVALHLAASGGFSGKIITLGTRISWPMEVVDRESRQLQPETIKAKVPAFAGMLEKRHGAGWKELVMKTAELLLDIGQNDYLSDDRLKSIINPVLLGIGDKDQVADPADTYRLSRLIPDCSMFMLPGTRHQLETADTKLLAAITARFISG